MSKYLSLLAISWKNGLVYRMSLLLWRVRQFLSTIMSLSVWTVIFATSASFGQYTEPEMITYIFVVALLQNIILSSVLNGLSQTVYSGKISHELLKPVNIYLYLGMQDVADKAKNIAFIILESLLLFSIFKPEVILPSFVVLAVVTLLVALATILNFFISLVFGALGFWSPDTWAPRFLFFMFIEFTAGRLFPIDILPQPLQFVIGLTPFPYFSFIQTQLFLGRIQLADAPLHLAILSGWVFLFGIISLLLWRHGLKDYAAAGQ